MSRPWRDHLLADHRDELDAWWDEQERSPIPSDTELARARRVNWLDAARQLDPSASLGEELQVRLTGDSQRGALAASLGDVLLRPLNNAVLANAKTEPERGLELELVGLSSGSTVLHFGVQASNEDVVTNDEPPVFAAAIDGSVADAVVLRTREIAHLRYLTETHPQSRRRTVSGRVTELKESGVVKLKAGESRNSTAYEVRIEQRVLRDLRLFLGAWETFSDPTFPDESG